MRYLRRASDGRLYPYSRHLDARADFAECTADGDLIAPYVEKPMDQKEVTDVPKSAEVRALEQKLARMEALLKSVGAVPPPPVERPAEPEAPERVSSEDERLMRDLPDDKDTLVAMALEQYGVPMDKRMSVTNMKRQIVESMKAAADN